MQCYRPKGLAYFADNAHGNVLQLSDNDWVKTGTAGAPQISESVATR